VPFVFDMRCVRTMTAVTLLGLTAACATAPESCDPNAIGLGGAFRCGSNMFEARLDQNRTELDGIVARTELAEGRAASLQAEATAMASDTQQLNQALASLQTDIDRARLRLNSADAQNNELRSENQVLEEQLEALERRAASLLGGDATREEIARELEEIERTKNAMREFSRIPIF